MTPHIRSLGECIALWVKSKMAAKLFREEPPSTVIKRFLSRTKLNYMVKTDETSSLQYISSFFREVESSLEVIEEKYLCIKIPGCSTTRWHTRDGYAMFGKNPQKNRKQTSLDSEHNFTVDRGFHYGCASRSF
jgi:hypothetical protein